MTVQAPENAGGPRAQAAVLVEEDGQGVGSGHASSPSPSAGWNFRAALTPPGAAVVYSGTKAWVWANPDTPCWGAPEKTYSLFSQTPPPKP